MAIRLILIAPILLVLVEIGLFALAGQLFGVVPVLLSVLVSALAGLLVIRWQGFSALGRLRSTVAQGTLLGRQIADAMLIGLGGALLIVPGYFSDLCGLLLLVPPVRSLIYSQLVKRFRVVSSTSRPADPSRLDLDPDKWRDR